MKSKNTKVLPCMFLAVISITLSSNEKHDSNHDLCDAGTMLPQLSYQPTGCWSLYGSIIYGLIIIYITHHEFNVLT